jgi:hypothetical protein
MRDTVSPDLRTTLRALKLGQMLDTLPERLTLARQQKMAHADLRDVRAGLRRRPSRPITASISSSSPSSTVFDSSVTAARAGKPDLQSSLPCARAQAADVPAAVTVHPGVAWKRGGHGRFGGSYEVLASHR